VHPVFADPKTDFVFKRIFGAEARKPLLVALLNHLLKLEGERRILDVQYAAGDAPQTLIDRWAYFFREATHLSGIPSALAEEPFRAALEVTRVTSFSSAEWEAYERAKMAEQDARGALAVAHQEGHKTGLVEGHKTGSPRAQDRARRGAQDRARRGQARRPAALALAPGARAHGGRERTDGRVRGCRDPRSVVRQRVDRQRRRRRVLLIIACAGPGRPARDHAIPRARRAW